ncbi:MAG: hypothetical protein QOE95_594, partial [Gaiellaceae bacterium]|nr:hypothetical protein [Gaiellaceae bacterium]
GSRPYCQRTKQRRVVQRERIQGIAAFQGPYEVYLRWTNTGRIFQTFSKGLAGGNVNSTARTGATFLEPGSYRLSVNAIGSWVIRIVAGVERPARLGGGRMGFKGNGGRELPPFTTRRGGQMSWTNSGSIFQIFNQTLSGGGDVNSQAHRGTTYLDAGQHKLAINAIGNWIVSWKP